MNLFSLIADQVRNRQELFDEEGKIMQALINVGYPLHQADAALTLMQTLVQKRSERFFGPDQPFRLGVRTMNSEERRRFSADAFAFILKLAHLGVLSEDQREELIEKAMALNTERIEPGHVKTMVAFMVFAGEQEPDSSRPRIARTVWN